MFGRDGSMSSIMFALLTHLISHTLTICNTSQSLSENNDILDAFLAMCAQLIKKAADLFSKPPPDNQQNIDLTMLFQCGK